LIGRKELSCKEGLHYADADTHFLTFFEKPCPLTCGADAVLVALFKVVCRVY